MNFFKEKADSRIFSLGIVFCLLQQEVKQWRRFEGVLNYRYKVIFEDAKESDDHFLIKIERK
ncbi:MAG TPA: hypothetical protein VFQ86_09385 [Arachidicoccus soli]|nr:hypothetical protein [Arachidicoccus soli]